jgi:hypothetical protein
MSWTAFICIRLLPRLKVTALTIMPGRLVNDRLVLNYHRIDGAVAEVLMGAPQRSMLTKIAQ